MGLQNDTTTSVIEADTQNATGTQFGVSATDKVSFWGVTPVVQPTAAGQAAVTCSSGVGTASATSGIQGLTSTYNSTLIGNSIITLWTLVDAMRTALVNSGIMKGS